MKVIRLSLADYEDRLIDSRESPFIPSSFLLSEDLSFEECLRGAVRNRSSVTGIVLENVNKQFGQNRRFNLSNCFRRIISKKDSSMTV